MPWRTHLPALLPWRRRGTLPDCRSAGSAHPPARRAGRTPSELATPARIGKHILRAELDQDVLCELTYALAGRIMSHDTFQPGLLDRNYCRIHVLDATDSSLFHASAELIPRSSAHRPISATKKRTPTEMGVRLRVQADSRS